MGGLGRVESTEERRLDGAEDRRGDGRVGDGSGRTMAGRICLGWAAMNRW